MEIGVRRGCLLQWALTFSGSVDHFPKPGDQGDDLGNGLTPTPATDILVKLLGTHLSLSGRDAKKVPAPKIQIPNLNALLQAAFLCHCPCM